MTARHVDEQVIRLATRQHGVFSRAQALREGATDRIIGRRISAGSWLVLEPGVYSLRAAPATWHRGLMAAVLAGGCGTVVSHRAAAALHGLAGFRPGRAEITIPAHRHVGTALARVHRSTDIVAAECGSERGIPVTRPARTIVDVAATLGFDSLVEAYDEAVAARLVTHQELLSCLERTGRRGRAGTAAVRRLLVERGSGPGVPTGRLEHDVLRLLLGGGVPRPLCQFSPPWRTGAAQRVDFAWPEQRLILEADGRRWHSREADFCRDRQRDRQAAAAGWTVVRVTWEDVRTRSSEIVAQVHACLAVAA